MSECTVHDSTFEGKCGCGRHHFPRPAARSVWDRWADKHPDVLRALRAERFYMGAGGLHDMIEELGDA